jgi:uncharacterized MnhB-related membrane protein
MKKPFRIGFDNTWALLVLWVVSALFCFWSVAVYDAAPESAWLGAMSAVSSLLLLAATLAVAVAFVRALLQHHWRRALVLVAPFVALALAIALA